MTQQRDLKRRIRERQTKTGESYVTARGHVLAQRPSDPAPLIPVIEPIDVTDAAAELGLRCRVLLFPMLAARLETRLLLERVRDALLVCEAEPLRDLGLRGESKPMPGRWVVDRVGAKAFLDRVRAGIGGVTASGHSLAMHVDGVVVLCTAWHVHPAHPPALVLTTIGEQGGDLWGPLP